MSRVKNKANPIPFILVNLNINVDLHADPMVILNFNLQLSKTSNYLENLDFLMSISTFIFWWFFDISIKNYSKLKLASLKSHSSFLIVVFLPL